MDVKTLTSSPDLSAAGDGFTETPYPRYSITRILALFIVLLSALVLSGRILGYSSLNALFSPNRVPMVTNSAVCFLAAGICLFILSGKGHPLSRVVVHGLSVMVILTGILTLIEYTGNVQLGIDELITRQPDPISDKPGRMSILSALNFILVGCYCWVEARGWRRTREVFDYLMLACLFTTLYPFTGTLFGAVHVNSQSTNMAISTALGFFLFTAGYFLQQPYRGFSSLLFTSNVAGVILRRILLPLAVLYPLLAFLTVQGEKAGLYNSEGSMVFMLVTSLALFTTIVLVAAQTINRIDDEREQYKQFFKLSSEVLMIARSDGTIGLVSNAFTRALGYSSQEGTANSFYYFVHPGDVEEVRAQLDRMKQGASSGSMQARMNVKDGSLRHFIWSFTQDRRSGNVYAAGYDITEIKEAQQVRMLANKLQRQNEQLESFAHIASHNLRSHVGNLSSLLQLHKEADLAEQSVLLGMVQKVTGHLKDTLADLIESLRIKEDTDKERQQIYFDAVLTKTKDILASQLLESKASITAQFDAEAILFPATYLESIFLNLISNAVKYRSPNRSLQIHMETTQQAGEVILRVRDNGLGIDMQKYGDKLFGLYKTFHPAKDAKGLGLFITKAQVEAMGGHITAESEVDKGTTFIIRFGPASLR